MDTEILKQMGMSATTIAIFIFVYRAIIYIKGKKLISDCCGKKLEVGLDIRNMEDNVENGTTHQSNPIREQTSRPQIEKASV